MKINKRQVILSALICVWAATAVAPMAFTAATVQIFVVVSLIGILIWENLPTSSTNSFWGEALAKRSLSGAAREALAGDDDLAEFKAELKGGSLSVARISSPATGPAIPGVLGSLRSVDTMKPAEPAVDPLKAFFAWAPEYVVATQKLIEPNRQTETPGPQLHDTLVEMQDKISELKQRCGLPELRPAWQLATALEGTVKAARPTVGQHQPIHFEDDCRRFRSAGKPLRTGRPPRSRGQPRHTYSRRGR